jgi:hypothetical protein
MPERCGAPPSCRSSQRDWLSEARYQIAKRLWIATDRIANDLQRRLCRRALAAASPGRSAKRPPASPRGPRRRP